MKNLAGNPEASTVIMDELRSVCSLFERTIDGLGEVPSDLIGKVQVGEHVLTFRRCWVYYSVQCEPALPVAQAVNLDQTPFVGEGSRYGGSDGILGDVVRAEGFAGGERPSRPVSCWHIDTMDALRTFVGRMRELCA
jgi:hypothetical protein